MDCALGTDRAAAVEAEIRQLLFGMGFAHVHMLLRFPGDHIVVGVGRVRGLGHGSVLLLC